MLQEARPNPVILNEFLLLDFANVIIKKLLNLSDFELRERVSQDIYNNDLEKFNEDYKKYFDEKFSKNKDVGSPQLINFHLKQSTNQDFQN